MNPFTNSYQNCSDALTISHPNTSVSVETSTRFSSITNNFLNTTNTAPSLEDLEWKKFVSSKIPVAVYLIILCIVGVVGNIHALLVYSLRYKPSNHRTFVVSLAAVDLIACAFSIPFETVDTRYSYTFTSVSACKFFRFLNHFVTICSGFLLGVIATERYQKACHPMGRQLTRKEAKWACIITSVVSFVLSIPGLVFYAPAPKPTKIYDLVGMDCTVSTTFKSTSVFKGYNSFLLLLCTIVFILCIFTYSFVGKVLYRQMIFRRSSQTSKQRLDSLSSAKDCVRPLSSSDGNGNTMKREKDAHQNSVVDEESSVGENYKTSIHVVRSNSRIKNIGKKLKLFDRSKQITLMFLVATAVSYAGYLPHLILVIMKAVNRNAYENVSDVLGAGSSILMRGYFINNVTNPLVYCFMDDRFRRECKKLYCKLKHYIFGRPEQYYFR